MFTGLGLVLLLVSSMACAAVAVAPEPGGLDDLDHRLLWELELLTPDPLREPAPDVRAVIRQALDADSRPPWDRP